MKERHSSDPYPGPLKAKEIDAFESKYGFKPTVIRTSLDAVAVFVHTDNPLKCLSLAEVDAVFSKNRRRNYPNHITTWDQPGLSNEWNNKPLSIYGRKSAI
ncbi:MAG: hypothetical protein JSW33_10600 [bacterium]|nr:MAG: hypothetical protein JSW33_10600 [bacterium]